MKKPNITKLGKNPFRVFFISIVVVCCVTLSTVYYYSRFITNRETQQRYANVLIQDFENQLEQIKGIATQIGSNYEFHPHYFEESVTRELDLLRAFTQYRHYSSLTQEYFYYYGSDRMYCSSGNTLDYNLFLRQKASSDAEREHLSTAIATVMESRADGSGSITTLATTEDLYVLSPIRVRYGQQMDTAVVGAVIDKRSLEDRFSMLIGGIQSDFALYNGQELLYSNHADATPKKWAIHASSASGAYTLYYQTKEVPVESRYVFLQYLLIFTDLLLIFVVANIFAARAYKPIEALAHKYKGSEPSRKYSNSLDELSSILAEMHVHKASADLEIQKKQKHLQEQILRMLLENVNVHEISSYLDNENIHLEGPFFCVISIAFLNEKEVTKEFTELLRDNLEEISSGDNYIYTIHDDKRNLIHVICSFASEEEAPDLLETIFAVAEGYDYVPTIGVGNIYQALELISASYLESVDDVYVQRNGAERRNEPYVYLVEEIHSITAALEFGDTQAAMEKLEEFLEKLKEKPVSMLMLRYAISNFCGEIRQISQKYQLDLSKQNIALLMSAKNVKQLESGFKKVIHEFSQICEHAKKRTMAEKPTKICQYIDGHFMEYDLSIEKVAEDLHMTTAMIRQAVLETTGKGYKDYVISLRISYAKELLAQTDLSVADVCEKVGYGNISHFINIFKKSTGFTPAKYRRDVQDNASP